jgi:hypothetical protein
MCVVASFVDLHEGGWMVINEPGNDCREYDSVPVPLLRIRSVRVLGDAPATVVMANEVGDMAMRAKEMAVTGMTTGLLVAYPQMRISPSYLPGGRPYAFT